MRRALWMTELGLRGSPPGQVPRAVIPRLRASASLTLRVFTRGTRSDRCGGCGKPESDGGDPPRQGEIEAECFATVLARFHPDVIVRTDSRALDPTTAEYLTDSGIPVITTSAVDRPHMTAGPQAGCGEPAAVVTLSEFGRAVLDEQGIESRLIPPGVDPDLFTRPAAREHLRETLGVGDRFVVAWTATGHSRLELPVALQAFAAFAAQHADVVLNLHGIEPSDELTRQIQTAGVSDWVIVGGIPSGDLTVGEAARSGDLRRATDRGGKQSFADMCTTADVLILPTPGEGTGLPFLQAMACGVPIIATDCSVVPELLAGRGELIQVKRRHMTPTHKYLAIPEVDHLVALMEKLYHDPELRAEYSRKGRQFAQQFTWERCALAWALLIGEVVGAGRRCAASGSRRNVCSCGGKLAWATC